MSKKKTKKDDKKEIKIHPVVLLSAALLRTHPTNSNRQSREVFNALRENIREEGFDEPITVRPMDDGFYEVVSGNHRFDAGVAEGMLEFPCVVRDDWDAVKAELQSVRRNYARGSIDKDLFTVKVNKLVAESGLLMGDVMHQMGFNDPDKFALLYKEEKDQMERAVSEATVSASAVQMIDDLGYVISAIMEKYGDSAPNSFIVFPASGRNHLFVAANPSLKRTLEAVATHCVTTGLDINIALSGLLAIGMQHSNFIGQMDPKVKELGSEQFDGNSDIQEIKRREEQSTD